MFRWISNQLFIQLHAFLFPISIFQPLKHIRYYSEPYWLGVVADNSIRISEDKRECPSGSIKRRWSLPVLKPIKLIFWNWDWSNVKWSIFGNSNNCTHLRRGLYSPSQRTISCTVCTPFSCTPFYAGLRKLGGGERSTLENWKGNGWFVIL